MIEVIHNPDKLPFCTKLVVQNPTRSEFLLRKLMESRQPRGMRLRHVYDVKEGYIELSARTLEPIRVAMRYLADCGIKGKRK